MPDELARWEKRLATTQAAMKRLEQRQRAADEEAGRKPGDHEPGSGKKGKPFKRPMGELDPKAQDNFTDPESRIMKTSTEGYQQCYNAQAVVDGQSRIIVATTVSSNAADAATGAVREHLEAGPKRVLADSGYGSESNLEAQIDGYVAIGREKDLGSAALPQKDTAVGRMVRKLKTKRGRERYRKRKHIAEPPFGWVKSVLGFRQFSFRGLENAAGEWDLISLAVNLRRLNGKIEWVGIGPKTCCRPARPQTPASLRGIPRVICDRSSASTGSRTTISR